MWSMRQGAAGACDSHAHSCGGERNHKPTLPLQAQVVVEAQGKEAEVHLGLCSN